VVHNIIIWTESEAWRMKNMKKENLCLKCVYYKVWCMETVIKPPEVCENYVDKLRKISELCKKALDKWYSQSFMTVNSKESFCYYTDFELRCKSCICPPEICADRGNSGYIAQFNKENCIRDEPPEKVEHMRQLLIKHIIRDVE